MVQKQYTFIRNLNSNFEFWSFLSYHAIWYSSSNAGLPQGTAAVSQREDHKGKQPIHLKTFCTIQPFYFSLSVHCNCLLHYLLILQLLNRELGTLPRLKVLPWPCAIILFRLLDKSKDKTGLDLVMGNSKSKLNVRSSLTENLSVKEPLYLGMAQHWENKPWFSCKESTSLAVFPP